MVQNDKLLLNLLGTPLKLLGPGTNRSRIHAVGIIFYLTKEISLPGSLRMFDYVVGLDGMQTMKCDYQII